MAPLTSQPSGWGVVASPSKAEIADGLLHPPAVYMDDVDPDSVSLGCVVSSLTTEPSPQPQVFVLFFLDPFWDELVTLPNKILLSRPYRSFH